MGAHTLCQGYIKTDSRQKSFFSMLKNMADKYGFSGLENCTRPLVFTSGSSVRASGNCNLLARQDE